ncbi:hypothetical protein GE09DRAFT_1031751 [Coniochaeta sp. 2T2.1]|nr:hypothetical protein GE09DRAFT_1031751 [Coniochaeta sp. 2T2.1]
MLKKKAGFKPKAPVRRNAGGPSSQGPERQPSKTPAPPSASTQPTPTSGLSQTPAPESTPPVPPIPNVPADKSTAGTITEEPATAPPGSSDTQATQIPSDSTTVPAVSESTARPDENVVVPSVAPTESRPANRAHQSTEPAPSAATSTTDSSVSRNDTEAAPSQPPESAITTPSVADTSVVESPRASRRAASQRVPLPTGAPSASPRPSALTTTLDEPQLPTVASTAPQPPEAGQQNGTATATQPPAPLAIRTPVESATDIQQSVEAITEADNAEPAAAAPKPKRAPRKRKPAAEATETDGDAAPAPKKPRQRKKAAAPTAAVEGDNPTEGEGEAEGEDNDSQTPAPKKRAPRKPRAQSSQSGGEGADTSTSSKRGGFRHRSPTPEDAEEQEVDQRQVKMGDLVKDLRIGKKFSRHDELLERQRMKKLKAKMGGANIDAGEGDSAAGSKTGTPAPAQENGEASSAGPSRPLTEGAPQFQIIDGQIVVNQSTLQFDRHAAAAREAGDLEEEVEDDFTHHTTSNTYMKRVQKPNHWTEEETDTFYHGLRMWGTDFALLCKMFPGKNRRHVKLKFNREERAHPAKVNAALVGEKQVTIDLDEYKSHTGLEYKSVDEIEREQARVEEEFEAEQRRAEEEALEEARKKKEELFGKKEEVEKKGKGRGRRKKEMGMGF